MQGKQGRAFVVIFFSSNFLLPLFPACVSPGLLGSNLSQAKKWIRARFWKPIKIVLSITTTFCLFHLSILRCFCGPFIILLHFNPRLPSLFSSVSSRPLISTAGSAEVSREWRMSTPPTPPTTMCNRASSWPKHWSKPLFLLLYVYLSHTTVFVINTIYCNGGCLADWKDLSIPCSYFVRFLYDLIIKIYLKSKHQAKIYWDFNV